MKTRFNMKKAIPAALFAGLMLSASAYSFAQDAAPPPHGEHGPGPDGGPFGHHRHGGPFMHELKQLDLSDAQRETIRGYVKAAHEQERANFEGLRSTHRAFETTAPGSAGYSTVVTQMADAAADAAREHMQANAALRAQIASVLTDAQRSKMASDLANLPEPPPRPQRS